MASDAIHGRWTALSASVRGAAHARTGLPNQDAAGVLADEAGALPAILAVSDGHGSAKCLRSDLGAKFAVEVAIALLAEFAGQMNGSAIADIASRAAEHLPRELVARWRQAVAEHIAVCPLEEAELARLDPSTADKVRDCLKRNEPYLLYGATVVGCLLTDDYLLAMQLGDGELLSVRRSESDGAIGPLSIERPLPADPSLLANETTSLSQPQAATQVRLCCLPIGGWPPGLVMLATDGYPNSFESPAGFDQAASDLVNALDEEGPAAVAAVLPGWLEETSLLGSGDDISVALLYSPLRHSPLTEEAPQP